MKINTRALFPMFLMAIILVSCGRTQEIPLVPGLTSVGNTVGTHNAAISSTGLWGYYDVRIDAEKGAVDVQPNRHAMFTMNLVKMMNSNPACLGISVNSITPGDGYVDIDFDVSITHPISSAQQFNVYDVRGVFIGDAGTDLFTDFCLAGYPHWPPSPHYMGWTGYPGSQEMMDDPTNADGGGPDGYTRWFSPKWFKTPGLFGYTQGLYASEIYSNPDYHFSADLNPYKLFADGLGPHENLVSWIDANPTSTRVFSSGATNTRNYYARFSSTAFHFGYAVIASWEGVDVHPANQREAIACQKIYATEHPDYFVFEFKLYDPLSEVESGTGMMKDYVLHLLIVSDNASGGTILLYDDQKYPKEVGPNYCIWHHEIPTEIMQIYGAYDFWVVARYPGYGYGNPAGVPNELDNEELAAWFCFELDYSDVPWK